MDDETARTLMGHDISLHQIKFNEKVNLIADDYAKQFEKTLRLVVNNTNNLSSKLQQIESERIELMRQIERQNKVIATLEEKIKTQDACLASSYKKLPAAPESPDFLVNSIVSGAAQRVNITHCSSGIYFLVLAGDVVYIGQSVECHSRIGSHTRYGGKEFDSAFMIPCEKKSLNDWEAALVCHFKPKLNGMRKNGSFHVANLSRPLDAVLYEIHSYCSFLSYGNIKSELTEREGH